MKKLFLISTLLAGLLLSVLSAKPLDYEFTPIFGINTPDKEYDLLSNGVELEEQTVYGFEIQFNEIPVIHPEISITFAQGEFNNDVKVDISRFSLNGVLQYDTQYITPFFKIGGGLNLMSEPENYFTTFFNGSVGMKLHITDNIALKGEAVYIIDHNNNEMNANVTALAGFTISFGGGEKVVDDSLDSDGIITNLDDKVTKNQESTEDMFDDTLEEEIVNREGIAKEEEEEEKKIIDIKIQDETIVDINVEDEPFEIKTQSEAVMEIPETDIIVDADYDGDGVLDSIDECPNTPFNSLVKANGCLQERYVAPQRNILHLNIEFNNRSFKLTKTSKEEVIMLADFLNSNISYNVKIIGYTDNKGSRIYNKTLSKKRANAIKKMLIKNDVEPQRVISIGMGEANPIADNNTESGRAKNRRIEIELLKY